MEKQIKWVLGALVALACAAVQAAPNMLVNLDATDFVASPQAWPNRGDLSGEFVPVGNGSGTAFAVVEGVPAVSFTSGNRDAAMTNGVSPHAICGTAPWAFEIWVYKPQMYANDEVAFAWTARNQWPGGVAAASCMEFRYGMNTTIAVEHNGDAYNLPWTGGVPAVGQWHHVAVTRDANGYERLFLDGTLRVGLSRSGLNIRNDVGYFTLGAVRNMDNTNFDMSFRGSIARLRIYDGPLTAAEILQNYAAECAAFGLTPQPMEAFIWDGTPGSWLPWATPGNWLGGAVPSDGLAVFIDNKGKAAGFSGTNVLANFLGADGGFQMTGGLLMVTNPPTGVSLATASGAVFDFELKGGKFHAVGAVDNNSIYLGREGGSLNAIIGGGSELAWLCSDRALQVGKSSTGKGYMEVLQNGLVTTSNNTFFVTAESATGTVVVAGGEIRNERGQNFNHGHGAGAQAKLIVNDGVVGPFGDFVMSQNGQNASSRAELFLNGGLVWINRIFANKPATNIVYLNGGTFRNRDNRTGANPDQGFLAHNNNNDPGGLFLSLQVGGVCFDVIPNTTLDITLPFIEDPASPGGGLTKIGEGWLNLRSASTFTGDIIVQEGQLNLRTAESLPPGVTRILLEAPGCMGYDISGGAALLLPLIDPSSTGGLVLYGNNMNEGLDLSQHPNLSLALNGTYTGSLGKYAPAGNVYRFTAADGYYNAVIADGTGPSSVIIEAASPRARWLVFEAENTYTGGTTINGGTLEIRRANALGARSAPGIRDIGIYNGAALKLNNNVNTTVALDILSRIKTDSKGIILITGNNNTADYDLSALPGISLSSDTGAEYDLAARQFTPYTPDIYRFGGGHGALNSDGFKPKNMTDIDPMTPVSIVIDFPGNPVRLWTNNLFTGGIIVTNGGNLSVRDSTAMGGPLASPRADFIYINGGGLRPNTDGADILYSFSLPDHGLTVGPLGMTLSTPEASMGGGGNGTAGRGWAWLGDLSGTGPITNGLGTTSNERGFTAFGGANNTWAGTLTLNNNNEDLGTFAVGWGNNFSWVKTNIIQASASGGTFGIATDLDITWSDKFEKPLGSTPPNYDAPEGIAANIGLRKLGTGTLTLDVPSTYRRMTKIESGTLKVGAENAIPWGGNRGNLHLINGNAFPAGVLDLNGFDVNVNGLNVNGGTVIDSSGLGSTLIFGNNNQGGTFFGKTLPPAKMSKTGTATQTFWKGTDVGDLAIQQGTVNVGMDTAFGDVEVNGTSVLTLGLATTDGSGLTGEYYWFGAEGMRSRISPAALLDIDTFDALLALYAPTHVQSSMSFGETFDAGYSGSPAGWPGGGTSKFQNGFGGRENYYGRWTGEFYAEAEGDYLFATASDDGSAVYINRQPAVTNSYSQAHTYRAGEPVFLTQGWHDILVAYYQGGGDRGLTVYMTPPGGEEAALPQALLRPYPATFGGLSGTGSRVEVFPNMTLLINGDTAPGPFFGRLVAGTEDTRLVKQGTGTLAFGGQVTPEFYGEVKVESGTLALHGGNPFVYLPDIAAGATLAVRPVYDDWSIGLKSSYYDGNYNVGSVTDIPLMDAYFNARTLRAIYNTTQTGSNALAIAENFWYPNGNFFPGLYSREYPPGGTPTDKTDFGVRFQGVFLAFEPGEYTFGMRSDDRADMFIDGMQIFTNTTSGQAIRLTTVSLEAGSHDFQIALGQGGGGYYIEVSVQTPTDSSVRQMPNALLRPGLSTLTGMRGEGNIALPDEGSYLRMEVNEPQLLANAVSGVPGSEFEKNGADTLTLLNDNDGFEGVWYVMQGTLVVGDGATSGWLGQSDRLHVATGARLVFNRADDVVFTGLLTGGGEIGNIGGGTVTLCNIGDGFKGVLTAGNFVIAGAANLSAASFPQGPDPANVRFGDGITLRLDPVSSAPTLMPMAFSNVTLDLQPGTTNAYYMSTLLVAADATVRVEYGGLSGLIGRYYGSPSNADPNAVTGSFGTQTAAANYLEAFPLICKASTWETGDAMDFAENGSLFPEAARLFNNNNSGSGAGYYWGALWKGKIRIAEPGLYTFRTRSDDNSILCINGKLVVDNNGSHGMQDKDGSVELTVGVHDFFLAYYQGNGGYGLRVSVALPGQPFQLLPNSMLITDPDDYLSMTETEIANLPLAAGNSLSFTLEVGRLGVVGGPGVGTLDIFGDSLSMQSGTLLLNDFYVESAGGVLEVIGKTKMAVNNLHVITGNAFPQGQFTKIADFSQASFIPPQTMTSEGTPRARPAYRAAESSLYLSTSNGTVLILR